MKQTINRKNSLIMSLILLIASTASTVQATDLSAELQNYIEIFQGSNFQQQRKVIDQLGWSGISDPRLFDVIVSKLSEAKTADGKQVADRASWYAKALARSGSEQYRSVILAAANDAKSKKTRKHAANAIGTLDKYIVWNPKIAAGVNSAAEGRLMQHRVANMLNDADIELMRIGAKRVYWGHSDDKELVSLAAERLKRDYQGVENKDQIDAVAWLIKALAQSGDSVNKGLLVEISESANNKKVRKYAKKYVDYL